MSLILDDFLESLLKCWTHELEHEWLEQAKEQLVLGLLELDVKVLHINVNFINLEKVLLVGLVGGGHLDLEAETGSTEEDISDTSVAQPEYGCQS